VIRAQRGRFVLIVYLLILDPDVTAEAALMYVRSEEHHILHGDFTRPTSHVPYSAVTADCQVSNVEWVAAQDYDFNQLAAPDWSRPTAIVVRRSSGGEDAVKISLQKALHQQLELFTKATKGNKN
jgi:hypothetical protein